MNCAYTNSLQIQRFSFKKVRLVEISKHYHKQKLASRSSLKHRGENKIITPISILPTQIHCKFKDFHVKSYQVMGSSIFQNLLKKKKLASGSSYDHRRKKIKAYWQYQFCLHKFIANAKIFIKSEYNLICLTKVSKDYHKKKLTSGSSLKNKNNEMIRICNSILLTQIHCKCKDFNSKKELLIFLSKSKQILLKRTFK